MDRGNNVVVMHEIKSVYALCMRKEGRSVDIDCLRVIAIILMMAYHTAYDLDVFYGWNMDVFRGAWWWVGKTSAMLFLLLVGISFQLSWKRHPFVSRSVKRGALVFCYGLVVTAATYAFDPSDYVRFGILHLIGVAMMILPFLPRKKRVVLPVAIFFITAGVLMPKESVATSLLIPFGLLPEGFRSVDYYPVLPWLGIVLLGAAVGKAYAESMPKILPRLPPTVAALLTGVSRRSLLLYMLHQPLLLVVLHFLLGPT